jgi:hypothetical protein
VLLVAFLQVAAVVLQMQVLLLQLLRLLALLKAIPSKALAHLATSTPRLILSGALSRKPVTI